MAGEFVRLTGIDELRRQLDRVVPAMRYRVLRNSLAAGARLVRDEAKRVAPTLSPESARRNPYRKPGTVRDAIRVRTSKQDKRRGDVGVFVNVKPLKTGRGAKNPNDPYYWRFLEFPTRNHNRTYEFLKPAVGKLPLAAERFSTLVARWINKVNKSGKVEP